MTKIIVVANQKGGVGKTVYTVNLAAAFALMLSQENASRPGRVLVLDVDPQANANATLAGGIWRDAGQRADAGARVTLDGLLMDSLAVDPLQGVLTSAIPVNGRSNLDFIPTHKGRMNAALHYLEADRYSGDLHLREILDLVRRRYRFIFIDTPPALNALTLNALVSADHVIVPVKLDGFAWDGFNDVARTIDQVRANRTPTLSVLGIQPSMCNFRKAGEVELYESLQGEYGNLVLPPFSYRADYDYAKEEGLDIFSYKPGRDKNRLAGQADAAREFARIAQTVRKVIW